MVLEIVFNLTPWFKAEKNISQIYRKKFFFSMLVGGKLSLWPVILQTFLELK